MTTLENHEGNVEHLSSKVKLTYGKEHEIAQKLQISRGTVNSDLTYLRKQAQDNLQKHIHEVVPEYYQKCLWGMKGESGPSKLG